ncbi:MAG: rhomboid family intramembrane serine protease [Polyangiaceae bacterium]
MGGDDDSSDAAHPSSSLQPLVARPAAAAALVPWSSEPASVAAPRPGAADGNEGEGEGEGGSPALPWGLRSLGPVHSERRARDWALVLQSMSIWHVLRWSAEGWMLFVRDDDGVRAAASIARYETENRDWPPRRVRERPRFPASPVAALTFAALAAFFMITGPARHVRWFSAGTSVAELVVGSEPWRAVTALTLHADAMHVVGNVISGVIFGSAVHRRLGPGGGSLAILGAGAAGNFINAVFHTARGQGGHASIGASTAVFGAIGVLAATQMLVDRSGRRLGGAWKSGWVELVAPAVGGLALLGALGAGGPRTDLGAHLWGLVCGGAIGLVAGLWQARSGGRHDARGRLAAASIPGGGVVSVHDTVAAAPRWWVQPLFGAIALGLLLGCWQLAIPALR